MKKLFILGGSGLVGETLLRKAVKNYQVTATYNTRQITIRGCKTIRFDLNKDKGILSSILNEESPDVIVNTIAYSNVDACETDKNGAYSLHVEATKQLKELCNLNKIKLIYISTDWVFDGKKNYRVEDDIPKPINYYGVTRLLAENVVIKNNKNNVVLRPAVIYGWHPNSRFLHFVLNNLKSGKNVEAFTDQRASPTFVGDLAESILQVIETNARGIYHTVGSSCVSRFEFAKVIAEKFGFNTDLVKPIKSADRPQIAKRPTNSCLDNSKASKELGIKFSTIEEGISKVVEQSRIVR